MTDVDPSRWAGFPEAKQKDLLYRMRAAAARRGRKVFGDQADAGVLARQLDDSVVTRDYLELIHETLAEVLAGTVDRVIIETPPQVGKTTALAWWVFNWIAHHPRDPVILASYGADLAAKRGRMIRTLVERHGAPYGLLRSKGQWARNNWETTAGASMRTCGMDTGITGEPANLLVIDDPHKNRAEAESKSARDLVWDTYSSSLLSRLRPGAPIVMILTRWHEDDLAARILESEGDEATGGRWRVLRFPAIAWFAGDPLDRQLGEPLQHPWIEATDVKRALLHWEERKRTSTMRDWFALYQCNPQPTEGSLLTEAQVKASRHRGALPPAKRVGVAVDPSGGGRDVAGVIGGMIDHTGRLYWTHDRSAVMSADEWSREACLLAHEIGADFIVFEWNYGGDQARMNIRTAWKALSEEGAVTGLCPRVLAVHAKRNKQLRAEPMAQQVIEGNAKFYGLLTDFEREWTSWQLGDKDSPGRLDAGVYLGYAMIRVPGAEMVVSNVADKPKEPSGRSRTAARRIER